MTKLWVPRSLQHKSNKMRASLRQARPNPKKPNENNLILSLPRTHKLRRLKLPALLHRRKTTCHVNQIDVAPGA